MVKSNLSCNLSNGFVHNWLIADPEIVPVKQLGTATIRGG